MGAMNTPEIVEAILREAMTAARAAGVRITQHVGRCVEERDGVTCACALGCSIIGVRTDRPFLAVMKRLNISNAQAGKLAEGFDGTRSPHGPQRSSKWRDLGEKLRLEFSPAPAKAVF